MPHLTPETLARLVDEAADPREAAHLQSCIPCRLELEEMREQTALLSGLGALDPPAGAWEALAERLAGEGLIRAAAAEAPAAVPALRVVPAARRAWWAHPAMRAAAAVALFVAGGVAGASLRGGPDGAAPADGPADTLAGPPAPAPPVDAAPEVDPGPAFVGGEVVEPAPATARLASTGGAAARTRGARRAGPAVDAARRQLEDAEAQYLAALQRYAALANAEDATPEERLRALDGLVATTREALDRSPADAVLNGYHMAALRERESVFRQVAQRAESTWF